jgi:hypothetical protein
MSAEFARSVSFLSFALLPGLLAAQAKLGTVEALRKENAALRQQVKQLRAQIDAKPQRPQAPIQVGWEFGVQAAPGKKGNFVIAKRNRKGGGVGLDLVMQPGTETTWYRISNLGSRLFFDSTYNKALEKLRDGSGKLNSALAPADARKVVHQLELVLIEIRRALWLFEQAEKTRKKDKPSDSPVISVQIPVLATPIQMELNWPLTSNDSNKQLFFSFRRF